MAVVSDFYLFLISVIFISLSGVMAPGPLFAMTVSKGLRDKIAGVLISFGHGVIEVPLMFLIYFGFAELLKSETTQTIIGFIGGLVLIYMAFRMMKAKKKSSEEYGGSRHSSFIAGILATGANPYFLLWWATIGTALVLNARVFGLLGFVVFAMLHWICDLFWNALVSITVFGSRRFWTKRVHSIVFGFCFVVLIGFGAWFVISALLWMVW